MDAVTVGVVIGLWLVGGIYGNTEGRKEIVKCGISLGTQSAGRIWQAVKLFWQALDLVSVKDAVSFCVRDFLVFALFILALNGAELKAAKKILETNALKITGAVLNGYDAKKSVYGYGATEYQYDYKSRNR